MTLLDPHLRVRDHAAHWHRLAGHLHRHPEHFGIALDNLDRWETWGRTHPAPLREWRSRILEAQADPEAMRRLLRWLADDNHDAEPLKSCSPFVGLPLEEPEQPLPQ